MANYFVKTTGNDGNSGATWALAKATIQAGMNLCSSGGTDVVYVAPGEYNETLVAPTNSGASFASPHTVWGDTTSTVQDGGGNTSGVTAGMVQVRAGTNTYDAWLDLFTATKNYWKFKNLIGNSLYVSSGTVRPAFVGAGALGIQFEDVVSWGAELSAFAVVAEIGNDVSRTFVRCVGYAASAPWYITGGRSAIPPTVDNVQIENCVAIECGSPSSSTYQTCYRFNDDIAGNIKATLTNCYGYAPYSGSGFSYATATKTVSVTNCVSHCAKIIASGSYTASTGCYQYGSADAEPTGWTETDVAPMIPIAGPIKAAQPTVADFSSANTWDFLGNSRASSATKPGPFEVDVFGYPGYIADSVGYLGGLVPNSPTGLTASDGTYSDKVALSWTAGGGQATYKVYRNTSDSFAGASAIATGVSATSYDDTTAVAGTTYYYWVLGTNTSGDSTESASDSGERAAGGGGGGGGSVVSFSGPVTGSVSSSYSRGY